MIRNTALHCAALAGHARVARILLDADADLTLRTNWHVPPRPAPHAPAHPASLHTPRCPPAGVPARPCRWRVERPVPRLCLIGGPRLCTTRRGEGTRAWCGRWCIPPAARRTSTPSLAPALKLSLARHGRLARV